MKTDSPNFPKNLRGEDFLRLIYEQLAAMVSLMGPAEPLQVTDITKLSNAELDALNPGDRVIKLTGTAGHAYVVSYKDAENGGLCLTYCDASSVETVSYDHSASGWSYNSTDVTPIAS